MQTFLIAIALQCLSIPVGLLLATVLENYLLRKHNINPKQFQ